MARAIFLFLLALNLLLLGWHALVGGRDKGQLPDTGQGDIPSLNLADRAQIDAAGNERSSTSAASVALSGTRNACLSLGPFESDEEVAEARARLAAAGIEGEVRRAEGQLWVGYWIYLSPSPDRDTAVAQVEALRAQGISDIYVEPAGEMENAVSLGVFAQRESAQRRYREIRDLGFEPQIARRNRRGAVYWLDFIPDEAERIDPADFQSAPGRIVRLASRACQLGSDPIE